MKKGFRAIALCLAVLLALPACALGDAAANGYEDTLQPISASLNQKMALRTGPGTKYTELGTYPKDTPITLYEQEIGGSVSWGMLEFRVEGGLMRAYTGMKRIDAASEVPWANTVTVDAWLSSDVTPRRGLGETYVSCKQTLPMGTALTLYHKELGYAMADFYFPGDDQLTRAWIPESCLSSAPVNAGASTGGGKSGDSSGSSSSSSGSSSSSSSWSGSSSSGTTVQKPKTNCYKCHGSGKITCTNCDGRGYKEKYISVPNYSGSTNPRTSTTSRETCFKCHGSGSITCTNCGGSGKT